MLRGPVSDSNSTAQQKFFDDLIALGDYGGNAVLRRAVARTKAFLDETGLPIVDARPDRDNICDYMLRRCCNRVLTFEDTINEGRADTGRRNVFLDPKEALSAGLHDFFSGRVSALEVRHLMDEDSFKEIERNALSFVASSLPKIEVRLLVGDVQSIVVALRSMADSIEILDRNAALAASKVKDRDDGVTILDSCSLSSTIFLGDRWSNNGRKLEKHYVDEYACTRNDTCCSNRLYAKRENDRWVVAWQDNGSPTNRPPQNPPNYTPQAWGGQLPLFPTIVPGMVYSDFGWRNLNGQLDFHAGIDIVVGPNAGVLSTTGGRVVWVGLGPDPSNMGVVIRDGDVTRTYWHIRAGAGIIQGQQVRTGQTLGNVCDWGGRTHLHYAEHTPPGGDFTKRSDTNARNPIP